MPTLIVLKLLFVSKFYTCCMVVIIFKSIGCYVENNKPLCIAYVVAISCFDFAEW